MKKSVIALAAFFAAVGAHAATISGGSYNIPIVEALTELPPGGGSTGTLNLFDSWTSSNGAINGIFSSPGHPAMILSDSSGVQNYAVGETKSFLGQDGNVHIDGDNNPLNLAQLQAAGGGTFQVFCSTLSGLQVLGGGGNIATTQRTTAGCGGSIEYTYEPAPPTPTPEPASLALVGLALAGLAATRRRKA